MASPNTSRCAKNWAPENDPYRWPRIVKDTRPVSRTLAFFLGSLPAFDGDLSGARNGEFARGNLPRDCRARGNGCPAADSDGCDEHTVRTRVHVVFDDGA